MSDEKRDQVVRELAEAWSKAQEQFLVLRSAVDHAAKLVQLQEQAAFLGRERERALLGLGESVWKEAKRGGFLPPETIASALRMVEAIERKRAAHAAEISALLAEGEAVAARRAPARPPPKKLPPRHPTPLARGAKKR
ncbi:MAG: hypothetical protein ACKVPX_18970 [Myxococcaceae bacterium]